MSTSRPDAGKRAWRSPDGFVVDRGQTRVAIASTLYDVIPEGPHRELHEFAVLDARGVERRRCEVHVWSVDDELGMEGYLVVGGELRHFNLSVFTNASWRIVREERVVVGGLQELPEGRIPLTDAPPGV